MQGKADSKLLESYLYNCLKTLQQLIFYLLKRQTNEPEQVIIMYILTTLEFPTHNFDLHLLTTSVNAKYYY